MDNNTNKSHSQFELFPDANVKKSDSIQEHGNIFKGFVFTPENTVISAIIMIVCFVVLFSVGVERGKRVAKLSNNGQNSPAEKKAVQNKENSVLLLPSDEPVVSVEKVKANVEFASIGQRLLKSNENIINLPKEMKDRSQNVFTIQVASFKSKKSAQLEAKKLNEIGEDVFVLSKGDYSIVCVGRFQGREEAKMFSKKVKSRYNDFLIRRL